MKALTGARGATAVWFSGLSRRPLRLLLTILGIASGVALLFAVTAQNASLTSGTASIYREFAGRSKLELVALGPEGMPLAVAERVRSLPEVAVAVPVSEESISVRDGARSVDLRLFGVDGDIRSLGGALAGAVPAAVSLRETIGLYVPPRVAGDLGIDGEAGVETFTRVGPRPATITRILPAAQLGGLARIPVAFATLPFAELLTGDENRIQRVLVVPRGHARRLAQSLQRIGGPGTVVWSTATEARAADQASALSRSSSALFAALSLVVGGVLAYGAMALTMAERRREVAVLRALGCGLGALLFAVIADALLLGSVGTVLGILAGRVAAGWLLPADNSLLSSVFLLDSKLVVPSSVFVRACAAGVGTALLAVALPARALTRVEPAEALRAESESALVGVTAPTRLLLALGAGLGAGAILLTESGRGLVGVPMWVLAGLLAVPAAVSSAARTLHRLLPSPGGAARVGISEIAAFPARAIAAAAVVTLAVSGLVVVDGAVANLETGTARLTAATYPPGDLFVTAANRNQIFLTQPLAASFQNRLSDLPFVSHLIPWRVAFLNWGARSVLAYAFTDEARSVRAVEFLVGNARSAARALASDPSAVAVSSELASVHDLHIGTHFDLPTPAGPKAVHVVAIITDYGWLPGAVTLNPASYAAWWGSRDVTAYQLGLAPGVSSSQALGRVRAALAGTGLMSVSSAQMRARVSTSARALLASLRRTGQVIALAGLLAVIAATLAGVLGRIRRVSALRTIGMSLRDVVTALACETGCIVATGALLGGFVGIVGHALAIDYLSSQLALNVAFTFSPAQLVSGAELSVATVLLATLVALRWAARAPLALSLRDT
jgi:putative ABC transport system permease protein